MLGVHFISVPSNPAGQAQGRAPAGFKQPKLLDLLREDLVLYRNHITPLAKQFNRRNALFVKGLWQLRPGGGQGCYRETIYSLLDLINFKKIITYIGYV
jgi:hypothetical protein